MNHETTIIKHTEYVRNIESIIPAVKIETVKIAVEINNCCKFELNHKEITLISFLENQ